MTRPKCKKTYKLRNPCIVAKIYTKVVVENNRTATRMLLLPGEIRNLIYHYIFFSLLDSMAIIHKITSNKDLNYLEITTPTPELRLPSSLANRQFHSEALSYFCSINTFLITDLVAANNFFEGLSDWIKYVKRIFLMLSFRTERRGSVRHARDVETFFALLEQASGLRYLSLELFPYNEPLWRDRRINEGNWAFLQRFAAAYVKRRDGIEFVWSTLNDTWSQVPAVNVGKNYGKLTVENVLGEENMVGVTWQPKGLLVWRGEG